ncbi:MAG TPA: hypothetical protein VIT22_00445 [Pseudoxanthomonas sp.]
MSTPSRPADDAAARRKRVRRTAWAIGAIAVAIYVAFIASGVVAA